MSEDELTVEQRLKILAKQMESVQQSLARLAMAAERIADAQEGIARNSTTAGGGFS